MINRFPFRILSAIVCTSIFFLIIFHWFFIQYQYIHLLPPNVFNFVKLFKLEMFQGKSSVSNTYSLPFAIQMNGWAFHDHNIASTKLEFGDRGYFFSKPEYLWFADRKVNPLYSRPDLFVCFVHQNLVTALHRYKNPNTEIAECSGYHIVRQALFLEKNELGHKLIQRDKTNLNMWAIVQIGWDFPPYLEKLSEDKAEKMDISFYKKGDVNTLRVQYKYKQQNNVEESSSLIQLYNTYRSNYGCYLSSQEIARAYSSGNGTYLKIPEVLSGEFAIVVTPKSLTRTGDRWISRVFKISQGEITQGSECKMWQGIRDLRY